MAVYVFYWFLECSTYERLQLLPEHTDSLRFLTYCTTSCFRFECHKDFKILSYDICHILFFRLHLANELYAYCWVFFFFFLIWKNGIRFKYETWILFLHWDMTYFFIKCIIFCSCMMSTTSDALIHVHARQITLSMSISIWIFAKNHSYFF